jgi:uncharacterized damage-inducible protein DinB
MDIHGLLTRYASYDLWANTRYVERLQQEDDGLLDREAPGSFPSLRATLLHIRDAHNIWLCRLKGKAYSWPAEPSTAITTLIDHSKRIVEYVNSLHEEDVLGEVVYKDLRGNEYRQPAWQLLMHCFNHGTQHRGQVITMMRALGLEQIPSNDMVVYLRTLN